MTTEFAKKLRMEDATWREFLRLTPTAALIRLDDLQLLPRRASNLLREHIARLYGGNDSTLFRDWKQNHRKATT